MKRMSDVAHRNLETGEPFVIGVFADWCRHCVKLEPDWKAFEASTRAPVATITYETYQNLMSNHRCDLSKVLSKAVRSFPFVALVKRKPETREITVHVYDGELPISRASLTQFVKRIG